MPNGVFTTRIYIIFINMLVVNQLRSVVWGVPTFGPTVKLHKDPWMICKRGTPSISVGEVIRSALDHIG